MPFEQSERFEAKLKESGVEVATYYVDGLKHGFRSNEPGITAEEGKKLLEKTFSYFETKLK